jgi:hypothetical protein
MSISSSKGRSTRSRLRAPRAARGPPWIYPGKTYRFRLYADQGRRRLLKTVTVRGQKPKGYLSLAPNPCLVQPGQSTCRSRLAWDVVGSDNAEIWVMLDGRHSLVTRSSAKGAVDINWLQADKVFVFQLFTMADGGRSLLKSLTVRPRHASNSARATAPGSTSGSTPSATSPVLGQLDRFWPYGAGPRVFTLFDNYSGAEQMKVGSTPIDQDRFLMWFNKAWEPRNNWDLEQFRYCHNDGANPWLFLDQYLDLVDGRWQAHTVQTTKALFTPRGGATRNLIADGTYRRCGGHGQPYLYWKQNGTSYHLQVWGTINKDKHPSSNWLWFWDLHISKPIQKSFDCLGQVQTVKAVKQTESWWDNFSGKGQWWLADTMGTTGAVDSNGVPTGHSITPSRTIWHADGQLPYVMTETRDGKVAWCKKRAAPSAFSPPATPPSHLLAPPTKAAPTSTSRSCHTRPPWDWSYCTDNCPCAAGEGDCDRDSHCQSGLRCVHNVGHRYGKSASLDVCQAP